MQCNILGYTVLKAANGGSHMCAMAQAVIGRVSHGVIEGREGVQRPCAINAHGWVVLELIMSLPDALHMSYRLLSAQQG